MPITPGECGFTVIAGITLPTCPSFTAKDCILVNKVYDQCFTEELVTQQVPIGIACPGVTIPPGSTVGCIPITGSATCTFAGTVAVTPPLTPFFEEVLVVNSFQTMAPIISPTGVTICAPVLDLLGAARAVLWAPPGTTVTCDIVAFGDCTCTLLPTPSGVTVLNCVGKICKEIQVTAPVKLLVPSYGFCEATTCTHITQPGFTCLPQPLFPPERCQLPPTVTIIEGGLPTPAVTVTVSRLINGILTPIASVSTNSLGVATFLAIGGLEGALDTVSFPFPTISPTKTVSFPIPIEFTDVAGVAHDSATVCSIIFTQVGVTNTFTVTINGFLVGIPGMPSVPFTVDP